MLPLSNEKTRSRILGAAIRLFAEHGFDSVSIRDITAAAQANGAAITYHFGTKDELIRQAFNAIVHPISEARLQQLDEVLEAGIPTVSSVVRALVEPVIARIDQREGSYHRFHILAYALRRPFVDEFMRAEHDRVAIRFVAALRLALPTVGEEELWWRYDFVIGAMVHILLDVDRGGRLEQLSDGLCRTGDPTRMLEQLIAFAVAGLEASPLPPASDDSRARIAKPRRLRATSKKMGQI